MAGKKKYAAWTAETFRPVCDEFLDLDEEAFLLRPSLECCVISHLRKHRQELVQLVDKL